MGMLAEVGWCAAHIDDHRGLKAYFDGVEASDETGLIIKAKAFGIFRALDVRNAT